MKMEDFKKLQQVQLEIMDEVHRVCVENDICYYIIGGTALGAKRHGGFIPWDLDIDIAMPRKDYEKFAKVSTEKLSSKFAYRNFKSVSSFIPPHALVCMKNTEVIFRYGKFNPKEEVREIYLDIFPLDTAPENYKLQLKQAEKLSKLKRLKVLKRGYNFNNNIIKRTAKWFVSNILIIKSMDQINADFDKLCRTYEGSNSPYICSMASHYSYKKQCMDKKIYGKPTLIKFEDRSFYAPERLEEYLTIIYGDYMKLPPESERNINLEIFESVKFSDE